MPTLPCAHPAHGVTSLYFCEMALALHSTFNHTRDGPPTSYSLAAVAARAFLIFGGGVVAKPRYSESLTP